MRVKETMIFCDFVSMQLSEIFLFQTKFEKLRSHDDGTSIYCMIYREHDLKTLNMNRSNGIAWC